MNAIYDNEKFFREYKRLRDAPDNYNDKFEQPAVRRLLGDVCGKSVLDAGCGWGAMCQWLAANGAVRVVGTDNSEKMLSEAKAALVPYDIEYRLLGLEELGTLADEGPFDMVISSLALHYVADISKVFSDVADLLVEGGEFVFSMEHPIYTAPGHDGGKWECLPDGTKTGFVLDYYALEGERRVRWLGTDIRKYHHRLDTVFNGLIAAGFEIEHVEEPAPTKNDIAANERCRQELHRPAYLIVKAMKP